MTEFQGILIDEKILSDSLTFYSIFTPAVAAVFILLLWWLWRMDKKTPEEIAKIEKARLLVHHLQKHADKDPYITKQLEKATHQYKKLTSERRNDRFVHYVLLGVVILAVVLTFLFTWFPCYRDSVHKDYATYSGTFEVVFVGGRGGGWMILLPDDTRLDVNGSIHDRIPNDEGSYTGTLVYSSRSKLVLGIEWNENAFT